MGMVVLKAGEGEHLVNPQGSRVMIRVSGEQTNGQYTLIEAEQRPGSPAAPLHIHDREDEAIQVLEGRLIVEVDGVQHDAPAGSYILVPRGMAQRFWNPDPGPCRYQSIFSPSGQEHYFRSAYTLDPSADGYKKKLAEIRESFGLRYPEQEAEDDHI